MPFVLRRILWLITVAAVVSALGAALAEPDGSARAGLAPVYDFSRELAPWRPAPKGPLATATLALDLGRTGRVARFKLAGDTMAGLFLNVPIDETRSYYRPMDLSSYGAVRFTVYVPKVTANMHVAAYVVDLDEQWYQTAQRIRVRPGKWQTLEVDLSASGAAFDSVGHARPWGGYVAREVREIGVQLFSDRPVKGDFCIDDIRFVPRPNGTPPQAIYNFQTSGLKVDRYGCFEITFELSRTYANPFDPKEIDIRGRFTAPSGKTADVPAFFYQDYERRIDKKVESLVPYGPSKWKIRFCPREAGQYKYTIDVFDGERLETRPRRFLSVPSDGRGCVRVCPTDTRYFEFEDGTFFYPIGHNIPATFNVKAAAVLGLRAEKLEGTFAYDRFLDGMKRGHENFARIWLASWSFGLEWTRKYHRAYRDLGRYNLENAWKLDYVLDKATRYDIYVQLALTTFGHWRSQQFEGDWPFSPYNTANGGLLSVPQLFWTHGPAQERYERMLRYVMARWGYSTHVASWEISNEIDLVTGYVGADKKMRPHFVSWHERCVATIRKFDHNPHLVTTNFANAGREAAILHLPGISYSSTNHYNTQIIQRLRGSVWPSKAAFAKPAMMAECGYHWEGCSAETTIRYTHLCLWGSYMIPFAGAGMPWWWDFIDDRDLYHMFKPLAEYAKGEDRRNRGLEMYAGTLRDKGGAEAVGLESNILRNDHSGYFWIYETGLLRAESDAEFLPGTREGIVVPLSGLKDGDYRIEFWDTRTGEIVKELTVPSKGGTLACPVPTFKSDIAGKIKPARTAVSRRQ